MHPNEEENLSPYPLSRNFWRLLEQTINRQPEIWLWTHNRWQKWELSRALKDRMKDRIEELKKTIEP